MILCARAVFLFFFSPQLGVKFAIIYLLLSWTGYFTDIEHPFCIPRLAQLPDLRYRKQAMSYGKPRL